MSAEDAVQDFLFKDKPKRSYSHKRDVNDWVKFVESYCDQQTKELREELKSYKSLLDDGVNEAKKLQKENKIISESIVKLSNRHDDLQEQNDIMRTRIVELLGDKIKLIEEIKMSNDKLKNTQHD